MVFFRLALGGVDVDVQVWLGRHLLVLLLLDVGFPERQRLTDAFEDHGGRGWVGVRVRVVVQRGPSRPAWERWAGVEGVSANGGKRSKRRRVGRCRRRDHELRRFSLPPALDEGTQTLNLLALARLRILHVAAVYQAHRDSIALLREPIYTRTTESRTLNPTATPPSSLSFPLVLKSVPTGPSLSFHLTSPAPKSTVP